MNDAINEQLAIAPKEIKEFLVNSSWRESVKKIASEYNLKPEQTADLENEVIFVLLALEIRSHFKKNVIENVGVDAITAENIWIEVDNTIFRKIGYVLPTEIEGEENIVNSPIQTKNPKTLDNLIEDAKGNADNIPPILPREKPVSTKPAERPQPAVSDADFEARQNALKAGEFVMKTAYGNKPDPYREPLQQRALCSCQRLVASKS